MNKKINRLLLLGLILSLCFNIFFISGYFFTRSVIRKLRTTEGHLQLVAKKLKLNKVQEKELTQLVEQLKERGEAIKQDNLVEIETFWAEMIKDKPDSQKIKAMLGRSLEVQSRFQALVVDYLREFMKVLTPEQRETLVQLIKERNKLF